MNIIVFESKKNSSLKVSGYSVVVINCIARSSSARLCQETKTYFFQVCLPRSRMSIRGIISIIIIVVVVVQLLLSFTFSSASWRFFLSVESSSCNSLIPVFVLKTFMSKRKKKKVIVGKFLICSKRNDFVAFITVTRNLKIKKQKNVNSLL